MNALASSFLSDLHGGWGGGGEDLPGKRSRLSVSVCTEIKKILKFSLKENIYKEKKAKIGIQIGQNRRTRNNCRRIF
jgi:hypothetical protein